MSNRVCDPLAPRSSGVSCFCNTFAPRYRPGTTAATCARGGGSGPPIDPYPITWQKKTKLWQAPTSTTLSGRSTSPASYIAVLLDQYSGAAIRSCFVAGAAAVEGLVGKPSSKQDGPR